jgi:hypothetical protein
VVDVKVGHDHDRHVRGLDATVRELDAQRLVVVHPDLVEKPSRAAHVSRDVGRAARVKPGVDQDRSDTGMLDQECRHRKPVPAPA